MVRLHTPEAVALDRGSTVRRSNPTADRRAVPAGRRHRNAPLPPVRDAVPTVTVTTPPRRTRVRHQRQGRPPTLRPSRLRASCTSRRSSSSSASGTGRSSSPATIAFMSWYLLYVVMSMWAHDFMSTKVFGNVNVALVFGLLQFVSTFLIAWLYGRYMNTKRRPARPRAQAPLRRRARRRGRSTPMSSETLTTILFLVVVADHDRHHLLGQPATPRARPTTTPAAARSAASRTAWPSAATTCRRRPSSASPARSP